MKICPFPMEIFTPQSSPPFCPSPWSPHFHWTVSPPLLQISTMFCSGESLSLSSEKPPGSSLLTLLHPSLSFLVNVFSLPVPLPGRTLVTSSLSLGLKNHTWSSLCHLHPLLMANIPHSLVTFTSQYRSSFYPSCASFSTHTLHHSSPMPSTNDTVLSSLPKSTHRAQNLPPHSPREDRSQGSINFLRCCPAEAHFQSFVTLCDQL